MGIYHLPCGCVFISILPMRIIPCELHMEDRKSEGK
jgi:hypothetical protein